MARDEKVKLGSLWEREGARGTFMTGEVEIGGVKTDVILFRNTFKKEGSREPDWRIFQGEPRRPKSQHSGSGTEVPEDAPF